MLEAHRMALQAPHMAAGMLQRNCGADTHPAPGVVAVALPRDAADVLHPRIDVSPQVGALAGDGSGVGERVQCICCRCSSRLQHQALPQPMLAGWLARG